MPLPWGPIYISIPAGITGNLYSSVSAAIGPGISFAPTLAVPDGRVTVRIRRALFQLDVREPDKSEAPPFQFRYRIHDPGCSSALRMVEMKDNYVARFCRQKGIFDLLAAVGCPGISEQ